MDPAFQEDTDKFLGMAQQQQAELDYWREIGRITPEQHQKQTEVLENYYNQASGQAASHKHMQKMVDAQNILASSEAEQAVLDHWGMSFTPGTSINDEQFGAITGEQWKSVEAATPALIEAVAGMPDDHPAKPAAVRQILRNRALLTSRDSGLAPKDLVQNIATRMQGIEADGISAEEVQHLLATNPDAQAAAAAAPVAPAAAPITEEQANAQGLMPPSGVAEGAEVDINGVPHVVQAGPDGSMQYVPVTPTDGGGGPRGGPETAPSPVTPADGGVMEQVAGWYGGLDETSKMLLWIGVPLALAGVAMGAMGGEGSGGIGMLLAVLGIAVGGIGAFGGGDWLRNLFGLGDGAEGGSGGTRGPPVDPEEGRVNPEDKGLTREQILGPDGKAGTSDDRTNPDGSPAAPAAPAATAATGGAAAVDNAWSDRNISAEEATAMMNDPQQRAAALQHPQRVALLRSAAQNDPVLKADLIEAKKHPGYAIKALMHPAGQKIKVGPDPIFGVDLRKEKVGKGLSRAEAELFLRIAAQAV